MIIRTMDGNSAWGFGPYTDRGALAHFLDGIEIGEHRIFEKMICRSGSTASSANIRSKLHAIKGDLNLITRVVPEGIMVARLA